MHRLAPARVVSVLVPALSRRWAAAEYKPSARAARRPRPLPATRVVRVIAMAEPAAKKAKTENGIFKKHATCLVLDYGSQVRGRLRLAMRGPGGRHKPPSCLCSRPAQRAWGSISLGRARFVLRLFRWQCRRAVCMWEAAAAAAPPANSRPSAGLPVAPSIPGACVLHSHLQYTQLIARRVRENGVLSMLMPGDVTMVRHLLLAAAALALSPCGSAGCLLLAGCLQGCFWVGHARLVTLIKQLEQAAAGTVV